MQIIKVNPWKIYLHEKPIQKSLEFFLKNPSKIRELPVVLVEYNGNFIQIDGANRITAGRRLGLDYIEAIVFKFAEYEKYFIIKKWYGFTNIPLKPGNLELGGEYVVEVYKNNGWKIVAKITSRQYEMLLPFLEFSTRSSINGRKYRVYFGGEITHEDVVNRAILGNPYSSKTTAHFVKIGGKFYHVEAIERDEKLRSQFMSIISMKDFYNKRSGKRY